MLESHSAETYAVRGAHLFRILNDLRAYPETQYCFAFGQEHHLVLKPDSRGPELVLQYLKCRGHEEASIRRIRPNIEDVFISLYQESAHD